MDRTVTKESIDSAGMPASRTAERLRLAALVVTRQLLDGLVVAQSALVCGAVALASDATGNVVYVVEAIAGPYPKVCRISWFPLGVNRVM